MFHLPLIKRQVLCLQTSCLGSHFKETPLHPKPSSTLQFSSAHCTSTTGESCPNAITVEAHPATPVDSAP